MADDKKPNAEASHAERPKQKDATLKKGRGSRLAGKIYDQGEVKGAKSNERAPPPGKGSRPGPGSPKARQKAQRVLDDCHDKLIKLSDELGDTAGDQLETIFEHGKNILADDWEPKNMIRDSVSLSLNAVDSLYRVYDAAWQLFKPAPRS